MFFFLSLKSPWVLLTTLIPAVGRPTPKDWAQHFNVLHHFGVTHPTPYRHPHLWCRPTTLHWVVKTDCAGASHGHNSTPKIQLSVRPSPFLTCITHACIIDTCFIRIATRIIDTRIFCQKCPFSDQKKWHFEWPNQNSKTTFIVQTFPKYGPYDFYLVNLSLLGAILAIFQFCGFSGLFWPFSPCNCNV